MLNNGSQMQRKKTHMASLLECNLRPVFESRRKPFAIELGQRRGWGGVSVKTLGFTVVVFLLL